MKEIINTATVTYQYTIGTQSVTKSIGTRNVVVIDPCPPEDPLLRLTTMTACARCCQPLWLVAAVEGVSDKTTHFVFTADFDKKYRPLPEIFVNDVPIVGDIRRGVSLCVGAGQTLLITFGAIFPCDYSPCCICKPLCEKVTVLARICYIPCSMMGHSPKYVYSNPVFFKVL